MTPPVDRTLRSLAGLGFDAALDPDPGPDWIALDRYAAGPGTVAAGLRDTDHRLGIEDRPSVTGGWLVGDLAAAVTWPAAAALLAHDHLVATGPGDVAVPRPGEGRRLAARVTATVPCGGTDRPQRFATGIARTMHPVVEAVHRRTGRGRHALWGTVGDMVVAAFDRVGHHLGQRARARDLAERVLAVPSPLVGHARWHDVPWSGGTEQTLVRTICCLWYQLPRGVLCLTCPRASDDDRRRTLEGDGAGRGPEATGQRPRPTLSSGTATRPPQRRALEKDTRL